jgi:hypothetical protein
MGRMKQKDIAPAPNSLVASAARIRGGTSMVIPRRTESAAWHMEAWEHYRNIGEFRYSCDWIGGMLSKAVIYATVETVDGVEKIEEGSILEYLSALFGNADGRAEMFRLTGIHLSVTGECYLVGYPDPDPFGDGADKWEVAASTKCIRPSTAPTLTGGRSTTSPSPASTRTTSPPSASGARTRSSPSSRSPPPAPC